MPNFCEDYVEDTKENRKLLDELQKCEDCKYKKFYIKIKIDLNE
jgi:Zn-finger domain-containing protein